MSLEGTRNPGGGRRSKIDSIKDIDAVFLEVLREHTAGDPMKVGVKWTNLSKAQIVKKMSERGISISKNIVKKLLKKTNL